MPELLWKAYIDFEYEILGEFNRARELYQRLLQKTGHVKVWIFKSTLYCKKYVMYLFRVFVWELKRENGIKWVQVLMYCVLLVSPYVLTFTL